MKTVSTKLEKGQSLVLVALLMIAMVAMLALVLDGGYAYFQRRNAQTAADAGALAGARELCLGGTSTDAYNQAQEYACNLNGADLPPATDIDVNTTDKRVTVTSSISFDNIFASLIGLPETTVRAGAAAGCFRPCYGESVLPVVWSCRPPIDPDVSESEDCQQQRITWDQLQIYLAQSPPQFNRELYIIMDSLTYGEDIMCQEDPDFDPALFDPIQCDFDGDGEPDTMSSGGRSWVDLDGSAGANECGGTGEGANELVDWVRDGFPCKLEPHRWIPDETGNMTTVYDEAWDRWQNGEPLVIVPVFDRWCKPGFPNVNCSGLMHDEDVVIQGNSNQPYFHIIDYAAFYITCVKRGPSDSCPGQNRFKTLNGAPPQGNGAFNNGQLNSMKSIEGYFIEGIPPGLFGKCEGGVDTGASTLYLDPISP